MNNQTENETMVLSSDYSKAFKLNQHIKFHAEMAQTSLYEMCKGLKEMHDGKLYKELGYQNFEEYCEKEVGLKRRQTYKFISIADNLSENFVQSTAQIGTEKLSLLAKLDEPQRDEIVQNTDLESVTVKELKQKIKSLEDSLAWQRERTSELDRAKCQLFTENTRNENNLKKERSKNELLTKQIQELENRPVEVAVEKDTAEIERLTTQIQELQSQNDVLFSARENLTDRLAEEGRKLGDLKEQLEQERQAHQEEIENIKSSGSNDDAVLSEIEAYRKVSENSLHNLFTAILRQETFSREHLGSSVIEMLETYMKLFRFEDDSDR
ncbi:MAG: hypothetical protein K2G36_07400 [Ruminococcus sp.]|nr:hypothetical protein [Ruminococcus sp.]